MIFEGVLSRLQIHDIPLSSHQELDIIIDYLKEEYEVLKFQKLEENFLSLQTQLDLEFIPQKLVDSETALQVLRLFDTLQQSEGLTVLRVVWFE